MVSKPKNLLKCSGILGKTENSNIIIPIPNHNNEFSKVNVDFLINRIINTKNNNDRKIIKNEILVISYSSYL